MTSQNYSRLNHHTRYSAILINKLRSILLMPHRKEQPITSTEKTTTPRLVLIIGGARSGKSSFAEQLAASSERSVAFIATAMAGDDEMRERIARHRASRPRQWHTLEEPLDLSGAARRASALADVLLLDCVTLWLGNVLSQASKQYEKDNKEVEELSPPGRLFDESALKEIEALLTVVKELAPGKTLIVVTNEVGLGVVPAYPLGRLYRDTLGYVNQQLARAADRVYLMVAGIAVDIKRLNEEASL
jgi:adenosylcobinamide kinase / adenosylcobinamide-phosphate guanylyltransferase